ncbi:uncharacterized protein GGS22DRAFT_154647 [Annulohypoxylon maeteangense]|uniref:uncharacterized protein n=1 Tax=Annulohypoxylon maeteangense TaxID=1927788 RepID=UPI00200783B6|nr:uncharacterized protein GGS22DRAFT_154647 [Annulohypoxylon maeteangense]KAI0887953.1 hypothetical protein GGS22DRAFT_154647 [Annulohypoxylon maeteangense]
MPPSVSAPTPSLLLTKRLTAFLSSNLSPQIHTAALTTLSGKLLAHASPHPVGTLRTQCTVAASIWALYAAGETYTVIEALPPAHTGLESDFTLPPTPTPNAVTIQLTGGVMVIRHLRCGLLFVCIGPLGEDARPSTSTSYRNPPTSHSNSNLNPNSAATNFGPSLSPQTPSHGHSSSHPHTPQSQGRPMPSTPSTSGHEAHPQTPLGSPSEVASVASAGAATTASVATTTSVAASAVMATRRQAEELARWLDDKLGSLGVLEEGLGVEAR